MCQQVRDASEDDIPLVKENQPTLYDDIRLLFDPPLSLASLPLQDWREEQTRDRGQGRQDEVRHVAASTDLKSYVDWSSLAQVVRLLVAPPPADA